MMKHLFENKNKFLVINPPVEDFTAYSLWSSPFGLFRVAGALKEMGKEIEFLDFLFLNEEIENAQKPKFKQDGRHGFWKTQIEKPKEIDFVKRNFFRFGATDEFILEKFSQIKIPEIILIGSGMTYWYKSVLKTIDLARKTFGKKIPIIVGGVSATLIPEFFKQENLFVYQGEFFKTSSPKSYLNLAKNYKVFPLQIIKGCPFHCPYCASDVFYKKVSFLESKKLAETFEEWCEITNENNASFFDDALLLKNGEFLYNFMKHLKKEHQFHVPNALHIREIDEKLAQHLFDWNFKEIRLGFETVANKYDRKTSEKDLEKKLKLLQKAGYPTKKIGVYLLCGLPNQTVEEVEASIKIVENLGGRPYLSEFSPVPKTELFEQHLKESYLDFKNEPLYQNNSLSSFRSPVFSEEIMLKLKQQLSEVYHRQDNNTVKL